MIIIISTQQRARCSDETLTSETDREEREEDFRLNGRRGYTQNVIIKPPLSIHQIQILVPVSTKGVLRTNCKSLTQSVSDEDALALGHFLAINRADSLYAHKVNSR